MPMELIPQTTFPRDEYIIKGSAGQGEWAGIPWILISNKRISTTARKGVHIVYLFDSSQENVYLCLGTGWTFFNERYKPVKEALANIDKFVRYVRSKISELYIGSSFTNDEIDLDPKGILKNDKYAEGYKAGTILSKKYEINDQLSNEELMMDLAKIKVIYEALIKGFKINDFNCYQDLVTDMLEINTEEKPKKEKTKDKEEFSFAAEEDLRRLDEKEDYDVEMLENMDFYT